MRRPKLAAIVAFLLTAAAVFFEFRQSLREGWAAVALDRAISAANRSSVVGLPLTIQRPPTVKIVAFLLPSAPASRRELAAWLFRRTLTSSSAISRHARGVARLLLGDGPGAVAEFDAIPSVNRDAAIWNNRAAALLVCASARDDPDDYLAALTSANHAVLLDQHQAPSLFNRAVALQALGLMPAAREAWRTASRYADSPWRERALEHSRQLSTDDAESTWKSEVAHLERLSSEQLGQLVMRFPQQARRYAESLYVLRWADAAFVDDDHQAVVALERLRVIATALRQRSGELLLSDVVQSISAAQLRPARQRSLAAAFRTYRTGRQALKDRPGTAITDIRRAAEAFRSLAPAMASLAECYIGVALIDLNQTIDAQQQLQRVIDRERRTGCRHRALLAFALYHLTLCHAAQGLWSNALAAGEESFNLFVGLGEEGSAGTAEATIAQSCDFLGQRPLTWKRARHALSLLVRAGEGERVRVTIAGLSRAELRAQRWESAHDLVQVERICAGNEATPKLDADMFLRLAVASSRLEHGAEAQSALAAAQHSGAVARDPSLRAKLKADTDAVAGLLARSLDPTRAEQLLTRAIEFQKRTQRELLLPQLLLERGRSRRSLGHAEDAAADFERGICVLEKQRNRTNTAELRSGIFDDAEEVFEEAVALALDRGDVLAAWSYVERGRARAVAEEIASRNHITFGFSPASLHEGIMSALRPRMLIIEYEFLKDRVAIFTFDRVRIEVTTVRIRRSEMERQIRHLLDTVIARRPEDEVRRTASRLFDILLRPIRHQLQEATHLVVVSDLAVPEVPFAILFDRERGRYVVEDYGVAASPSVATFLFSAQRAAASSRLVAHAAIIANPMSNGDIAALPALPGAEREARAVAAKYRNVQLLLRGDATISHFIKAAAAADVVHFAGHCVTEPMEPWRSALILAPDRQGRNLLSTADVASIHFRRPRTIVLASCSTLRGYKRGIEGAPSISRAFLVAGVPSVIGTMWDVEDGETLRVVVRLHEALSRHVPPVEALRAAQVEALHSAHAADRHPHTWGAFQLLGAGF